MDKEQLHDMKNFLDGNEKQRLFLKYLKSYDWIIKERIEKIGKYVSEPELQTDAIFAIEEMFKKADWLVKNKNYESMLIDMVVLFRRFFLRISRQNKRDNMPLSLEERQNFY